MPALNCWELTELELSGRLPPRLFAHQALLDCATSSVMTRGSESRRVTFESEFLFGELVNKLSEHI
jgi:hypothetical protein